MVVTLQHGHQATMEQIPSAYETALRQYDRAVSRMDIDDNAVEYLRWPQREFSVNFPVRRDNGSIEMFSGYRVHHSTVRGPTKGGRARPDKGGYPLQPERHAGRSPGAGDVDDLEMRAGQPPLRRCQRRRAG